MPRASSFDLAHLRWLILARGGRQWCLVPGGPYLGHVDLSALPFDVRCPGCIYVLAVDQVHSRSRENLTSSVKA